VARGDVWPRHSVVRPGVHYKKMRVVRSYAGNAFVKCLLPRKGLPYLVGSQKLISYLLLWERV
jgi:hypothetical protein